MELYYSLERLLRNLNILGVTSTFRPAIIVVIIISNDNGGYKAMNFS